MPGGSVFRSTVLSGIVDIGPVAGPENCRLKRKYHSAEMAVSSSCHTIVKTFHPPGKFFVAAEGIAPNHNAGCSMSRFWDMGLTTPQTLPLTQSLTPAAP
jgi:hypothetical protein